MADTVPNTDNHAVAALAVAWEIVRAAYNVQNMTHYGDAAVKELTDAVVRSFCALINSTPVPEKMP